ncbi:hypothetical protein HOA92_01625 [archaeon]|jgi:preprotein translocase subunit SecF|nr:hypothetical protein [archaeon]MBT6761712.1 hypothetical protein [archaeon]
MSIKKSIKEIYENKYKLLLIIPFLLLIFSVIQIGVQYQQTGDFVNKGVSLKGGSTVTIPTNMLESQSDALELALLNSADFANADISVRSLSAAGSTTAIVVESSLQEGDVLDSLLDEIEGQTTVDQDTFSVEITGSSLGESFFTQTMIALVVAFLLMGLVVLIYFRTPIPSFAVILAAASDIVCTLAIFNLTGQKLTTAGIAALLMLIGYSVDTDILVTTKLLKRHGASVMNRVYDAMKTGMTMTGTTLIVITITMFLVKSDTVKQIMLILFIGLAVDLIMTWIQNVGILRMYLEKKSKK